jgi:hypothetical protein
MKMVGMGGNEASGCTYAKLRINYVGGGGISIMGVRLILIYGRRVGSLL